MIRYRQLEGNQVFHFFPSPTKLIYDDFVKVAFKVVQYMSSFFPTVLFQWFSLRITFFNQFQLVKCTLVTQVNGIISSYTQVLLKLTRTQVYYRECVLRYQLKCTLNGRLVRFIYIAHAHLHLPNPNFCEIFFFLVLGCIIQVQVYVYVILCN